jgi:hypothetical protein
MKAFWGNSGIGLVLDLGTRQLHAVAALPLVKSPWYPLISRLGGPQNQYGCLGEGEDVLPLVGIKL